MTAPTPNTNRVRQYLFIGGAVVFVLIALILYFTGGRIISTDDAYVQAAQVEVSANIAGRVTEVLVKENQQVHRGEPLFELDGRDYRIAVEEAKAKLADAKLQIAGLKATYLQHQADVRAAQETVRYQALELARQQILAAKGIASQAQLEAAQHALVEAQSKVAAEQQAQQNVLSLLNNNLGINVNTHPSVLQAQAALERAQLNLSYTVIKAPMDGVVSKVDRLQAGAYINTASPVFSLTSTTDIWVEANYKETELAHMLPGQQVSIEIDAYPGKTFHGHVSSFSSGTGASFALLPPENATGNWVKVVQRLPVRVNIDDLDPKRPLNAGLSAIVDVDTGHSRLKDLF